MPYVKAEVYLNSHNESILVVDDLAMNLRLLTDILSEKGYKVRAVKSGEHALQSVQANPPDLILLDIMMPEMDGYQVCERLKSVLPGWDVPVIFISAKGEIGDKVRAFDVGGVDYITKPFNAREVLARVETHLTLRRVQRSFQEKSERLEREVAERRRAERALHHYAERLKILREIDQSILVARAPNNIALAVVGRIRQLIPCQRVSVMTLTGEEELTTLAMESNGELGKVQLQRYRELFEDHALNRGLAQGHNDLKALHRNSSLLDALYEAGVRSYIAVPLFIHDELVGALLLESKEAGEFSSDDVVVVTEVAVLLAVAIRQSRLYEQTERERARSEALLLNVLPASVANDLKETGHTVPREFENVTVMFSDFVGFTEIASQHAPAFIIDELNEIFTAFDVIIERNECERIKTIGDAYMAVCGLPEENGRHAHNLARAALEIVDYLRERNTASKVKWRVRVGLHSGKVVGGVVGVKKYVYDVFGDTVNTAARMQSASTPMRVNVSEHSRTIIHDEFSLVDRGYVHVDGKGQMRMYFVEGC